MKIFCTFPIINMSKLNFWLAICIAKNFIWTTLKAIFAIFRYFCTLRFQISNSCISAKYGTILTCINLNFPKMYAYDWFCGPGSHIYLYIYMYIYIYIYTYCIFCLNKLQIKHTYIYIYIYIYMCVLFLIYLDKIYSNCFILTPHIYIHLIFFLIIFFCDSVLTWLLNLSPDIHTNCETFYINLWYRGACFGFLFQGICIFFSMFVI